jgi:hypothetical protein
MKLIVVSVIVSARVAVIAMKRGKQDVWIGKQPRIQDETLMNRAYISVPAKVPSVAVGSCNKIPAIPHIVMACC